MLRRFQYDGKGGEGPSCPWVNPFSIASHVPAHRSGAIGFQDSRESVLSRRVDRKSII